MTKLRSIHAPAGRPLSISLLAAALLLSACSSTNTAPNAAASADANKTSPGTEPPPTGPASVSLSFARITELLASPDRRPADRTNDVRRKPGQLLYWLGIQPGMVVLDLGAGGGYTTEVLARAVGPGGRVYGQVAPRAPGAAPGTLEERAKTLVGGNIIPLQRKYEDPVPAEVASKGLDLVTFMYNYHDLGHMGVDRAQMNKAVFAALKPGSFFLVADHAGRAGTGISESGTLHRVEEALVRKEVEAAGFRFIESADFLRNPADPRDKREPDPAQPKDEFVLKFVKP